MTPEELKAVDDILDRRERAADVASAMASRLSQELGQQDAKLSQMAELCKRARVECVSPRSVQAMLLDEAIRMVDPTWQPTKQLAGTFQSNGTKAAPKPWVPVQMRRHRWRNGDVCKDCGLHREGAGAGPYGSMRYYYDGAFRAEYNYAPGPCPGEPPKQIHEVP